MNECVDLKLKLARPHNSMITLGYFNFIFLTPLLSVIFSIVGCDIPSNLVVILLNCFLILFATKFYRNNKFIYTALFFIFIISFFLYLSSLKTDFSASREKYYLILYNVISPILVLVLMGNMTSESHFTKLLGQSIFDSYIKFMGIVFCLLFFVFQVESNDGRPLLPGVESPIWLARIFGTLLILFFINGFGIYRGFIDFFLKALITLIILTIASRGVILSVVLVLYYLVSSQVKHSKFKMILLRFVSLGIILVSIKFLIEYFANPENLYSTFRRIELFELLGDYSVDLISGNGLGSFGPLVLGVDGRDYPHNYFLEYLFEFGLLGFILSVVLVVYVFKNINNSFVGYISLFFFISSLSSGDIPGNSYYYLSLFFLFYSSQIKGKYACKKI